MTSGDATPEGLIHGRALTVFVLIDTSASLRGSSGQAVQFAIDDLIRQLRKIRADAPDRPPILMRRMAFSSGARWIDAQPQDVDWLSRTELSFAGVTDLGAAIDLLTEAFSDLPERAFAPVVIVVSDGHPTDDYRSALGRFLGTDWGRVARRVVITLGDSTLAGQIGSFASEPDFVFEASSASDLIHVFRWASTAVSASQIPGVELPLPPSLGGIEDADVW